MEDRYKVVANKALVLIVVTTLVVWIATRAFWGSLACSVLTTFAYFIIVERDEFKKSGD